MKKLLSMLVIACIFVTLLPVTQVLSSTGYDLSYDLKAEKVLLSVDDMDLEGMYVIVAEYSTDGTAKSLVGCEMIQLDAAFNATGTTIGAAEVLDYIPTDVYNEFKVMLWSGQNGVPFGALGTVGGYGSGLGNDNGSSITWTETEFITVGTRNTLFATAEMKEIFGDCLYSINGSWGRADTSFGALATNGGPPSVPYILLKPLDSAAIITAIDITYYAVSSQGKVTYEWLDGNGKRIGDAVDVTANSAMFDQARNYPAPADTKMVKISMQRASGAQAAMHTGFRTLKLSYAASYTPGDTPAPTPIPTTTPVPTATPVPTPTPEPGETGAIGLGVDSGSSITWDNTVFLSPAQGTWLTPRDSIEPMKQYFGDCVYDVFGYWQRPNVSAVGIIQTTTFDGSVTLKLPDEGNVITGIDIRPVRTGTIANTIVYWLDGSGSHIGTETTIPVASIVQNNFTYTPLNYAAPSGTKMIKIVIFRAGGTAGNDNNASATHGGFNHIGLFYGPEV